LKVKYNEKKELLIKVLEKKKSIDDVAKHLIDPQKRIMELIKDLENHFREKLLKLNDLKTELGRKYKDL
jgi:molybdenum-dependent DNA-binding transcriptional regulator ModE